MGRIRLTVMKRFQHLGFVSALSDSGHAIEDYLPYVYNRDADGQVSITPSAIDLGTFLA